MNEKELKLDWVEDGPENFVAVYGRFKLFTGVLDSGSVLAVVEWDGESCWRKVGDMTHKAAQLAAEQAARELCKQFEALGKVLEEGE
jgi:hypothetical protein